MLNISQIQASDKDSHVDCLLNIHLSNVESDIEADGYAAFESVYAFFILLSVCFVWVSFLSFLFTYGCEDTLLHDVLTLTRVNYLNLQFTNTLS